MKQEKTTEKNKLDLMLEKMNLVELLIFYHATLDELLKRGVNPIKEK